MNVLLLSMPDSFEHMPPVAIRMPNGALASLAGNVDPHHRVAIADLILVQGRVGPTVARLLQELAAGRRRPLGDDVPARDRVEDRAADSAAAAGGPDRRRRLRSEPRAGGLRSVRRRSTSSCAAKASSTFRELLRALETGADAGSDRRPVVPGRRRVRPQPATARSRRSSRPNFGCPTAARACSSGYTLLGRQVDVVETSRGCTYDCSFCSIIEMRGRNFHPYPIERVLADIADARRRGARAIFLVDDNITLDVRRFEALCQAIIDSGFDDVDYIVQAMTSPIAQHGATLAPLMRRAGFRYVFLGIENVLEEDLAFLKAGAKNAQRDSGPAGRQRDDRRDRASPSPRHVRRRRPDRRQPGRHPRVDRGQPRRSRAATSTGPTSSIPTPYPRTPMTEDFRRRGLIVDEDVAHYDGTTAVVRTRARAGRGVEFLRWRAERWMKLRHMPAACRHSPGFVLRHGRAMLAHTFAGTTLRSMLGLERRARGLRAVPRAPPPRARSRDGCGAARTTARTRPRP